MRTARFLFCILILFLPDKTVFAQSEKTVKEMKIKSSSVVQTDYKKDDTLIAKNTYNEYDKHGNLILEIEYFSDSTFKKKEEHRYDNHGNETDNFVYDRKGKLTEHIVSHFDNFNDKTDDLCF